MCDELLWDLFETQQPLAASRALALRLDPAATNLKDLGGPGAAASGARETWSVTRSSLPRATARSPSGRGSRREALLWVADTGAGIAKDELPYVFDRFWQVQKSARRGAGLGLAIVQGLVESHGEQESGSRARSVRGARSSLRTPDCRSSLEVLEPERSGAVRCCGRGRGRGWFGGRLLRSARFFRARGKSGARSLRKLCHGRWLGRPRRRGRH